MLVPFSEEALFAGRSVLLLNYCKQISNLEIRSWTESDRLTKVPTAKQCIVICLLLR